MEQRRRYHALLFGRGRPTIGKFSAYFAGAAAGLLAKALSLVAGFGNLWLLTQILTKEQFAGYVFVLAMVSWLALLGTVGLDRTILYRLSRTDAAPGDLVGGPLIATSLIAVLPLSAALAGIVALCMSAVGIEHLPDLTFWLTVLAPLIVTTCVGRIFGAWYWARGRIAPSLLIPASGDIARVVGLAIAFFVLPTRTGVAIAIVVAGLVPLVVWAAIAPLREFRHPARIEREDVGYGLKTMLARAADEGTQKLDILMIGLLATAAATADYAMAVRFAVLVTLVKGLLGPVLTPRLGRYSASGSREVLLQEYHQVRFFGLVAALFSASVLAVLARPALALFGEFEQSYSLLMILLAGYVVSVGFGSNAAYLTIAGHAGWTLVARIVLLLAMVALNLVLIPLMGATGAALSMAIGMAAVNILLCYIIWRLDRLATISVGLAILLGAAHSVLLLVGFDVLSGFVAAFILSAFACLLLVSQKPLWVPAAQQFFRKIRARLAE